MAEMHLAPSGSDMTKCPEIGKKMKIGEILRRFGPYLKKIRHLSTI